MTVKYLMSGLALMASGLLSATGYAATMPESITSFNDNAGPSIFSVKSKSWRDPAFGNLGWTHHSQWGSIKASKGQIITIRIVSQVNGIHPGCSVWRRGTLDTAPNRYVQDHFYPQRDGVYKIGATDESTGAELGNIIMPIVVYGYDLDGNTKSIPALNALHDGVPGKLVLKFKAPATALYQFVVGGFNPDTGVDNTVKHNVEVKVMVTGP
ncbi:Cu_bind_CorA domain-containing protein [Gammaproteobacteria bacterium]